MTDDVAFRIRARDASGGEIVETIRARDRKSAILQLEQRGIAALSLEPVGRVASGQRAASRRDTEGDRLLVLQQIAVMARAGIPIVEAVESIASALRERAVGRKLMNAGLAMRRGESIAAALETALPDYPAHVYALVRVGEKNGAIADVLEEAVDQLRHQSALRRDVLTALTYPAFLLVAAFIAVAFLLAVVVPRFANMVGSGRETLTGLSRFVLDAGMAVHDHPVLLLFLSGAVMAAVIWSVLTKRGQRAVVRALSEMPVIGSRIIGMQRANWARLMALASSSGVTILDAAALSISAAPPGRFHDSLAGSIQALRKGDPIADAFGASGALDAIDRSLLQTGQASGRIGAMFKVIADRHTESVRADMKRITTLLEQVAIILVATSVGVIVIGLVGVMTSVYEVVQ